MAIEGWSVRKQVPETDPEFIAEKEKRQNITPRAMVAFRRTMAMIDLYKAEADERRAKNEEWRAELTKEGRDPTFIRAVEIEIKSNNEVIEQWGKRVKEQEWALRKEFTKIIREVILGLVSFKGEERLAYTVSKIKNMFAALGSEVEEKITNGSLNINFFRAFYISLLADTSDEALYKLARKHLEDADKDQIRLEEIVEETKKEFGEAVSKAVVEGRLPKAALDSLSRIEEIRVSLWDKLLNVSSETLATVSHGGKMKVSSEEFQPDRIPQLKRTIFHELLHVLSGRSITIKSDGRDKDVFYRKSGVALATAGEVYSPNRWLNEAITEWLAIELFGNSLIEQDGYKGSTAYISERKELDRLLEVGLERNTVLDAYFENISSAQPPRERGQKFAGLLKRIGEIEGPLAIGKLGNKHMLDSEISPSLHNAGISPTWLYKGDYPTDYKIFEIKVTVGARPEVEQTENFIFARPELKIGDNVVTPDDQFEEARGILDNIKLSYPHVKVEVRRRN